MGSSFPSLILFLFLSLLIFPLSRSPDEITLKVVDVGHPILEVTPSPLSAHISTHGSKDVILCERVKVAGLSRLKLGSYASSFRVTVSPSAEIPERIHAKIQVCFQRNASLGLCQCEKDEWKSIQKGLWSSVMSPYEERYIDVKFTGEISGSVTIMVEEDPQRWRLLCLAFGFAVLFLAPIVSSWVPFYYSSSMVIGVLLVIIILLFQGMKLLPTGRKNVFYLTIYGSVLGVGSFLLHHFSVMVNSIVVNFGLSEEMHNPVSIFLLVGIVLAGAALGYWFVRQFVISDDGSVKFGVAQFVKWAIRIIAATFVFQSTLDTLLAMVALISCGAICYLISTAEWDSPLDSDSASGSPWLWQTKHATKKHGRAEFLRRSAKVSPQAKMWNSPKSLSRWSDSPVKGVVSQSPGKGTRIQQDYYSTFHRTPSRKKFTKKEWEEFTRESTRQAMAEWASSPEVTDWIIDHADRIQLLPSESSDDAMGSESDSSVETVAGSSNLLGVFKR